MKAVSALRNQFGGHAVKRVSKSGAGWAGLGDLYVRRLGIDRTSGRWPRADAGSGTRPDGVRRPQRRSARRISLKRLWYSSTLGSHRVCIRTRRLIRTGAERAVVSTIVVERRARVGRRPRDHGGARQQGAAEPLPVRSAREVLGVLRAVLFAPGGPGAGARRSERERRRYLDELATTAPARASARCARTTTEVLRQRAALLKTAGAARHRGDRSVLDTLDVWDGHLAAHGAQLDRGARRAGQPARALRWKRPTSCWLRRHDRRRSSTAAASTWSRPRRPAGNDSAELFEAALLDALARRRDAELERGVCLVGSAPRRPRVAAGRSGGERLCQPRGIVVDGVGAAARRIRAPARGRRRSGAAAGRRVRRTRQRPPAGGLANVAADAEQVLVTAAVHDGIPRDWDARRIEIVDARRRHRPGFDGAVMTTRRRSRVRIAARNDRGPERA